MIDYIYVIAKSGIPLYSASYSCGYGWNCVDMSEDLQNQNPLLFSSFMSAIFSMGQNVGGEIHNITMGKTIIHAYTMENIIGVLVSKNIDGGKKYLKEMGNRTRVMTELFQGTYGDEIKQHAFRPSHFKDFHDQLVKQKILESGIKYKKNCQQCVYDLICPYRVLHNPLQNVKERISSLNKITPLIRLSQTFNAIKNYIPLDLDIESQVRILKEKDVELNTIIVTDLETGKSCSFGYGCNFEQSNQFTNDLILNLKTDITTRLNKQNDFVISTSPISNNNIIFSYFLKDNFFVFLSASINDFESAKEVLRIFIKRFQLGLNSLKVESAKTEDFQLFNETKSFFNCNSCETNLTCINSEVLNVISLN